MRTRLFWFWLALFLAVPAHGQDSLLPTLTVLRQRYPTPMTPQQIGELLTLTARSAPNWALLRKDAGNRCPSPMGVSISCDFLVFAPTGQGFDVLVDAENRGVPVWNRRDVFTPDRFVWPTVAPDVPPAPPEPPPPVIFPPPVVSLPPAPPLVTQAQIEDLVARQIRTEALAAEAVHEIKEHRENVSRQYYKWMAIIGPPVAALTAWLQTRTK